jgi:hypothetical protein
MLTDIIPAAWRARVYAAYAVVAAAFGVVQIVYIATASPQPVWLTASLAAVAAIGTAIGTVANANVTPDPAPKYAADPVAPYTMAIPGATLYEPGNGQPPTKTLS